MDRVDRKSPAGCAVGGTRSSFVLKVLLALVFFKAMKVVILL